MKLTELAAAFRAEYTLLVTARGAEATEIPDSLLALWISEGLGLVVRSLHGITSVIESDVHTGETAVTLPADFGTLISASIDGVQCCDAVVVNTSPHMLRFSKPVTLPCRVVITYTPSIEVFSPSAERRQNWGALIRGSLDGDLILPDRYASLMKNFLLAKVLPDMDAAFQKELIRQKESAPSGFCQTFKYHFGV